MSAPSAGALIQCPNVSKGKLSPTNRSQEPRCNYPKAWMPVNLIEIASWLSRYPDKEIADLIHNGLVFMCQNLKVQAAVGQII